MNRAFAERSVWLPSPQHTKALIEFIHWSQGGVPLDAALEQIVMAAGVECGVISRLRLNKPAGRVAARADFGENARTRPLFLSFTADALGVVTSRPKPGAVFSLKENGPLQSELPPILQDWLSKRLMRDILFICLDNQGGEIDFLELHLRAASGPEVEAGIHAFAPELARVFKERRPGLVTESLSRQNVISSKRQPVDAPLLGTDNPAGLTRSEWRVCVLISRGLSAKAIGEELDIGMPTVRTHLKHIYSKTTLGNFHMLARRLVSIEEREALRGRHRRAQA